MTDKQIIEAIERATETAVHRYSKLVNMRFENVNEKLSELATNIAKQNGKVAMAMKEINELKVAEIVARQTRESHCPQKARIERLEEQELIMQTRTITLKQLRRWLFLVAGLIFSGLVAAAAIITLFR